MKEMKQTQNTTAVQTCGDCDCGENEGSVRVICVLMCVGFLLVFLVQNGTVEREKRKSVPEVDLGEGRETSKEHGEIVERREKSKQRQEMSMEQLGKSLEEIENSRKIN